MRPNNNCLHTAAKHFKQTNQIGEVGIFGIHGFYGVRGICGEHVRCISYNKSMYRFQQPYKRVTTP